MRYFAECCVLLMTVNCRSNLIEYYSPETNELELVGITSMFKLSKRTNSHKVTAFQSQVSRASILKQRSSKG